MIFAGCFCHAAEPGLPTNVKITLDQKQIGMGQSVTVRLQATIADGRPAVNCELLSYGNGHNPHFPALRSDPMALSGASRRKQNTSSQSIKTEVLR